jgi:hypothetical protein
MTKFKQNNHHRGIKKTKAFHGAGETEKKQKHKTE